MSQSTYQYLLGEHLKNMKSMDLIDIATIQMVVFQPSVHHHFAQVQTVNKTQTVIHLLSTNKKVPADGGHFKAIRLKVLIGTAITQMGQF